MSNPFPGVSGINIPPQTPFFPMQDGTPSSTTTTPTHSDSPSTTHSSSPKTPPQTPMKTLSRDQQIRPGSSKGYSTPPSQEHLHSKLQNVTVKRRSSKSEPKAVKDDLTGEKERTSKEGRSPRSRTRGNSLISSDDTAEIRRKKNNNNNNSHNKDTFPILSFQKPEHFQKRNSLVVRNNELNFPNFKDFTMSQGKTEIKSIDTQFEKHFEEHKKEIFSIECNIDRITAQIYENIIQIDNEIIEDYIKKNRFLPATQMAYTIDKHARELFAIIQNLLIPNSPIFIRLNVQSQFFIKFFKQSDRKSPLTALYYAALLELRSLTPVSERYRQLLSEGINLTNFLSCVDKIKNCQFNTNESGSPKLQDLNKKIYPLISLIFGDTEKEAEKVLAHLKYWNNSENIIKKLTTELNAFARFCIAKQNISCIEHFWSEPLHNLVVLEKDLFLPSIGNTPYKDLIESYVFNGCATAKISINNKDLNFTLDANKLDEQDIDKYFLQIIGEMYEAYGFETRYDNGNPLLESTFNMYTFMLKKNKDLNIVIDDSNKDIYTCFNLLKMGGPAAQGRARKYLQMGLGNLLTDQITLDSSNSNNTMRIDFHISTKKPQSTYVEIFKTYNLCSGKDVIAKLSTSWKIYSPTQEKWNFKLRILQIAIDSNTRRETIRQIEQHAVQFMQDINLLEEMEKRNIQISQNLNDSFAPEAQGIEIVKSSV